MNIIYQIFHLMIKTLKKIKAKAEKLASSHSIISQFFYTVLRLGWRLISVPTKFLFKGDYRMRVWFYWRKPAGVHQISNATCYDRYPVVFRASQHYFEHTEDLKLLSFGCATGEEAFTLRRYFPKATITGVDINRWNIAVCHKHNNDLKIHFFLSNNDHWREAQTYDAIYCMAVLQRTENRTQKVSDSSKIYPFEKFDRQLIELDHYLKIHGILIIDEADYPFMDATIASRYQPLAGDHEIVCKRRLFDSHNKPIDGQVINQRIFIKQA